MFLKNNIHVNFPYYGQEQIIDALIDSLQLPDEMKNCVKAREHVRSTAVPEGIAFPHCRGFTENLQISIATFNQPILWGDIPIRIVILLCSENVPVYIKTLAALCKILHDEENRNKILHSKTDEEIFNLIAQHPAFITL